MISSTFTSALALSGRLLLSNKRWRGNRRMIRESYLALTILSWPFPSADSQCLPARRKSTEGPSQFPSAAHRRQRIISPRKSCPRTSSADRVLDRKCRVDQTPHNHHNKAQLLTNSPSTRLQALPPWPPRKARGIISHAGSVFRSAAVRERHSEDQDGNHSNGSGFSLTGSYLSYAIARII